MFTLPPLRDAAKFIAYTVPLAASGSLSLLSLLFSQLSKSCGDPLLTDHAQSHNHKQGPLLAKMVNHLTSNHRKLAVLVGVAMQLEVAKNI